MANCFAKQCDEKPHSIKFCTNLGQ